jgi:hypothetical protein
MTSPYDFLLQGEFVDGVASPKAAPWLVSQLLVCYKSGWLFFLDRGTNESENSHIKLCFVLGANRVR